MKFDQWFEHKLTTGGFPYKVEEDFNAYNYKYVINVSDEYYKDIELKLNEKGCHTFWFPMSEQKKDMGLNSMYGAIVILLQAEQEQASVYLHCHAGSNRSRTVQAAYHLFRTGYHMTQEMKHVGFQNKLDANCSRGYLPPMAEMRKFLSALREKLADGMLPGSLTGAKIDTINNF